MTRSDNFYEIVARTVRRLPRNVQLSIALISGDRASYVGAIRTAQGIEYCDNRSAIFEIGSITKLFTATLLANAVKAGSLDLDTPVQEYLPFSLHQPGIGVAAITLRHLANHTSGMAHQPPQLSWYAILHGHPREPFRNYTIERFENYLRSKMSLAFPPGESYSYSNMGMSLVGYILTIKEKDDYENLLQRCLFKPIGMSSSTIQSRNVQRLMVPGLQMPGVRAPYWDFYALSPAAGIKSSAEDLIQFIRLQFSSDPAVVLTQTPSYKIERKYDNLYIGLGWHIIKRADQECILFHGGDTLGYSAHVRLNPIRKCAALVLSNLGNYRDWKTGIYNLCKTLFDKLADWVT